MKLKLYSKIVLAASVICNVYAMEDLLTRISAQDLTELRRFPYHDEYCRKVAPLPLAAHVDDIAALYADLALQLSQGTSLDEGQYRFLQAHHTDAYLLKNLNDAAEEYEMPHLENVLHSHDLGPDQTICMECKSMVSAPSKESLERSYEHVIAELKGAWHYRGKARSNLDKCYGHEPDTRIWYAFERNDQKDALLLGRLFGAVGLVGQEKRPNVWHTHLPNERKTRLYIPCESYADVQGKLKFELPTEPT